MALDVEWRCKQTDISMRPQSFGALVDCLSLYEDIPILQEIVSTNAYFNHESGFFVAPQ